MGAVRSCERSVVNVVVRELQGEIIVVGWPSNN